MYIILLREYLRLESKTSSENWTRPVREFSTIELSFRD